MARWHEFGIHVMEKGQNSSSLLSLRQGMQDKDLQLQNNASFAEEDIKKLQQIHLAKTGVLLSPQETIELGIRITTYLRLTQRPIPNESL